MKILCTLSGVDFYTADFKNMRVQGIHPLFSLPTKYLVSRAADWAQGKLSPEEARVLFLALLKSTGKVEFRTAANPPAETIQKNMERLLKSVGWKEAIADQDLLLPYFVVNHATRDLKNIGAWLETWEDIKEQWKLGAQRAANARSAIDKLQKREEALQRLIKSYTKKTEDYAYLLARWAMVAANVPKELHELWTSLFKLKGQAVYLAHTADLEELVEHMEDNLPHYDKGIYAHATLKHCRDLLYKNRSGDFGLGIPTGTDYREAINNPYKFVEDQVETTNKAIAIADAPTEKPQLAAFARKVDYIIATAKWNLANRHVQVEEEIARKQKEAEALDTLLNIEAEEAIEEEISEARQIGLDLPGTKEEEL